MHCEWVKNSDHHFKPSSRDEVFIGESARFSAAVLVERFTVRLSK